MIYPDTDVLVDIQRGLPAAVEWFESLIGACAVGLGITLYTFNTRHYRMIPNLTLIEPYVRA